MAGFRDSIIEVNTSALVHNFNYFKGLVHPTSNLILVIKANSYGAGAIKVAQLFENEKRIEYYAVASISEGIELRNAGVNKPVIVLSPDSNRFQDIIDYRLEPVIFNLNVLSKFIAYNKSGKRYPIHLNFDTGMHRVGFKENEIGELVKLFRATECIKAATVFSHYSGSGNNVFDDFTKEQSGKFKRMLNELLPTLPYQPKTHLNNSGGVERFSKDENALHRLGIGLYGHTSTHQTLHNVIVWKTKVSHIQWVEKGESVSYNRSWKAPKRSKIATVFVGYADGLNRRLSNGKWSLTIDKYSLPIVGDICMDLTMVDATGVDLQVGDELHIIRTLQDIENMAKALETITYEVQTLISSRIERIYV
jgi:alanine racemase